MNGAIGIIGVPSYVAIWEGAESPPSYTHMVV